MTDGGSGLIKHDGIGNKLRHQRFVIHQSRNLHRHVAKPYRKEAHRILLPHWSRRDMPLPSTCLAGAGGVVADQERVGGGFTLEVFEELLTLYRLKVPALLRKTNPIESTFSLVRHSEPNIKRTRGSMILPWWLLTRLLGVLVSAMLAVAGSGGADMGKSVLAAGPLRPSVSNPRYFTDGSQKVIYLTGSHTWATLQDMGIVDPPAKFDFTAFVNFMEAHGHNFMRMWVSDQARWVPWTTNDVYVEPLPYVREGPDLALDGKPKFNLEKFNQKYFDRLRARVIEAGEHGIYVSIMLFEGWSIEKKGRVGNPWHGHPFNKSNNINGIDGDPKGDNEGIELYTRSDDPRIVAALTRQEAYVKKVIDTVNELDNVLYEIANEAHPRSIPWQYHMINMIKLYESTKPKQHPVGMTSIGFGGPYDDTGDLFAGPADWISPSTNRGDYKSNPPVADGSKVIIIDTDHIWGRGGDYVWVWKSFLRGLNPIFMDPWEPLPGSTSRTNDPTIPAWGPARTAMGDTLRYTRKIDLAAMVPRNDLCSSAFCLANPGIEYLVYLPFGSHWLERFMRFLPSHRLRGWIASLELVSCTVTVDLGQASRVWTVEWFNPRAGEITPGDTTTGSGLQSFTAPFRGDAVLYLVAQ